MHGLIVVDKRQGVSSFDEIRRLRRLLRQRRMGHAGTLDPMATGILLVCVGHATRLVPWLQAARKTYEAELRFGWETSTDDAEGESVGRLAVPELDLETVRAVLPSFTGSIMQVPPAYSALRVEGRRAYELARAGETVTLPARPVEIEELEATALRRSADGRDLRLVFRAVVGKGTYIRSLARDIARALGTCGHLSALRRMTSGVFDADRDATSVDDLERMFAAGDALPLLSCAEALGHLPTLRLNTEHARALRQGKKLPARGAEAPEGVAAYGANETLRLLDPEGTLVAVGTIAAGEEGEVLRVLRGMPTGAPSLASD